MQAYAMLEAVVGAVASGAGPSAGAAGRKLQRNKARVSAAATPAQLARGARADKDRGVPLTAAQRKLARNKGGGAGLGGSMRASLGEREHSGAGW